MNVKPQCELHARQKNSIKSIYFGCKVAANQVEEMKSTILKSQFINHDIPLFKAFADKNRFEISNVNDANKLLAKFENLCSQKQGQLIGQAYFINKDYTKTHTNNKAGVCQINDEPFFIIHEATYDSNIYYSVLIDEDMMRTYHRKTKKQDFQIEPTVNAPIEQVIQERKEIEKREIAREQKTKLLLGQKNQKTMTFFDSWRYSGSEAACSKRCYDINVKNNGFKTLKEATSNNWQLVSKIEETEQMLDNSCTCAGSSVVLKK